MLTALSRKALLREALRSILLRTGIKNLPGEGVARLIQFLYEKDGEDLILDGVFSGKEKITKLANEIQKQFNNGRQETDIRLRARAVSRGERGVLEEVGGNGEGASNNRPSRHQSDSRADTGVGELGSESGLGEQAGEGGEATLYRIREDAPPKNTGTGYKVFVLKGGKLYPPMVANPGGEPTPVGVWLDADAAPVAGVTKTGRQQVKAGGKGTQGGSGKLAYRPGWHLGEIPYAVQFNRVNPETGQRELFPANFVWAEVEYANDVDYQEEAMSYGMNASGKFQHSLAGLPRVPENGAYSYRTNPDPNTDPWIITGAMKVNRILTPSEVDDMVRAAGREPQPRQEGAITDEQINALNAEMQGSERSAEAKRSAVEQLGEKLGVPVRIYDSADEVTHPDPAEQARRRASKGWFDPTTGEIAVVLGNNADVDDVKASIGHETIAHHGLRELIGEERYNEFLDAVYEHLRGDIKAEIDRRAGRSFLDDLKNGRKARSYEAHRRAQVDELFGRLAEKPFEEFNGKERNLWQWLKAKVRHLLNRFLGSLKLPKWFELGDNELRYMLWRSAENLRRGREDYVNRARDMVKRRELGLDGETLYSKGKKTTPSERNGAVSGNPSAEGLPQGGSAHLSHSPLTTQTPLDAAKVRQNTDITRRAARKIQNEGGLKGNLSTVPNAVSTLGKKLHLDRSQSSQSYYGDFYDGDFEVDGKTVRVRVSTHPANGERIGNAPTDDKISIVIHKDGEHVSTGKHAGYTEFIYEPSEISPADAANAIVKGIEHLIVNGEFVDATGKAHRQDYPYEENGITLYRPMGDTDDVWNDMSMGLDERITSAKVKLAELNGDDAAARDEAVRAIGGNLSSLRRAMSAQKKFDVTTVKRVADLARVLIQSGHLDELSDGIFILAIVFTVF